MKSRFPTDHLTLWRQRFVAIAREATPSGPRRREALSSVHGPRAPFLAPRSLRGIRLGCIRLA